MHAQHAAAQPRTRGARQSKRLRTLVFSALGTALAVFIGLSGAGVTYSFLRASAELPGATLQAGELSLLVNGGPAAQLGGFSPTPNTPVSSAFEVSNKGNVAVELTTRITPKEPAEIMDHALARITEVANSASCAPGLSGTRAALNGYTAVSSQGPVPAGGSRWFCLEIGLKADTPVKLSGGQFNFTLTVDGSQHAN